MSSFSARWFTGITLFPIHSFDEQEVKAVVTESWVTYLALNSSWTQFIEKITSRHSLACPTDNQ
jgi:hypothetical protein